MFETLTVTLSIVMLVGFFTIESPRIYAALACIVRHLLTRRTRTTSYRGGRL